MGERPFVFCALIKKRDGIRETQGARGGIEWGDGIDAVRGRLAQRYMLDGWSVEILEVDPVTDDAIAKIAALFEAPRP